MIINARVHAQWWGKGGEKGTRHGGGIAAQFKERNGARRTYRIIDRLRNNLISLVYGHVGDSMPHYHSFGTKMRHYVVPRDFVPIPHLCEQDARYFIIFEPFVTDT